MALTGAHRVLAPILKSWLRKFDIRIEVPCTLQLLYSRQEASHYRSCRCGIFGDYDYTSEERLLLYSKGCYELNSMLLLVVRLALRSGLLRPANSE